MKKALIAMSGGVDSSVSAYLIKQEGYETVGITLKLFTNEDIGDLKAKTCCSLKDVEDAKNVSFKLGMKHYVLNFTEQFKEDVISRFVDGYAKGFTPNPCIDCNRFIKFDRLLKKAEEMEFDYIVTGHYAVIEYDEPAQRFLLKKSVDEKKDQSYVLYTLTQHQLSKTLLPLGKMRKSKIRTIALQQDFVNAKKHDSQDICFVRDGNYSEFIESYTGKKYKSGNFIDINGNVIGQHQGIINYTIGQRKGLGLNYHKRFFVCDKNINENTVTLGDSENLYSKHLDAEDINLIACKKIEKPLRVKVKIRYNQKEEFATVEQTADDKIHIEFDSPQRAITKGQAVVLYDKDVVVGGGTIV